MYSVKIEKQATKQLVNLDHHAQYRIIVALRGLELIQELVELLAINAGTPPYSEN